MQHLGDITKIIGAEIPVVDCIIGGSPCQDLSQAGRRTGLAGERSGLFMEQIRIVKEMRESDRGLHSGRTDVSIRPRYMVWENVYGAFSSNRGEDFRCVLEEVARIIEETVTIPGPTKGKWSNTGIILFDHGSIAWRVFDAQYWGVPQRRRRICLVADFNGHTAPEIVFNESEHFGSTERADHKPSVGCTGNQSRFEVQPVSESLSGHSESSREKREEDSTYAEGSLGTGDPVIYDARGNGDGKIAPTMTGDHQNRITDYTGVVVSMDRETFNAGQSFSQTLGIHESRIGYVVRRLTPLECERLQGLPDNWTNIGDWVDSNGKKRKLADSQRYKAIGNGIALPSWAFVLKRLCSHYERPCTLGSLFDGLGSFPLIWEQINGKGSCLWASEIEDFCIAVTKERFS